jgi:hypothetical protein
MLFSFKKKETVIRNNIDQSIEYCAKLNKIDIHTERHIKHDLTCGI